MCFLIDHVIQLFHKLAVAVMSNTLIHGTVTWINYKERVFLCIVTADINLWTAGVAEFFGLKVLITHYSPAQQAGNSDPFA